MPPAQTASPINQAATSEIWAIDAATGQQRLLVTAAQVTAASGGPITHLELGDEKGEAAQRRQLRGYAWAPGGHALLLATDTRLAWFDLDTQTSRSLVRIEDKSEGEKDSNDASGETPTEATNDTQSNILSDAKISPDGRKVSFLRNHTLWIVDTSGGPAHAFTTKGSSDLHQGEPDWTYANELGLHSAYWWSPDSSSIAWLEMNDHAVDKYSLRTADGDEQTLSYPKPGGAIPTVHLFVKALSGGKPLRIDSGADANVYLPVVQWLPDGKHLAIERLSRSQKTLDLLLADPATGKTKTILTESDVYWINLGRELHFFADSHRFLWSSERSGFRHLYLYDTTGKQLAQLTHGDWEVTSLDGVNEAANTVYFTATEATPVERQLYRVHTDGSGFARITQEKGTHRVSLSPSGDMALDTWSDHATPPRHTLLHIEASTAAETDTAKSAPDTTSIASVEENLPPIPNADTIAAQAMASSAFEFVTVKSHLDLNLRAWIIKPPDFDPAKHYPVIFYVAGGPGEQIVRDMWGGDRFLWFAMMAQNGYIVFALDNRGTSGRGHLFEEPIHLRFAASEMADVRDGVQYLHSMPWVDRSRIGICGWSYGGLLVLHGMLNRPLLFKAGFAGSPIADPHLYDAVFGERYLEDPERNQDGWLTSSPLENAKYLKGSLLLAQATLDEKVHLENSLTVLDELLEKGKYADILLFPERTDLFEDRTVRLIVFQRMTDFFSKNL